MRLIARACLALVTLLPLACSAADQEPAFSEGKEYKLVLTPQAPADPAKVEVSEAFWYGCPHCYHFDPIIEGWRAKAPSYVLFDRIPSTLGRPEGETHARAFYVAETLGVGDKIHKPLFDAIHQDHKPMNSNESIRALFESVAGVKPADFDAAASSFMVDARMRRADSLLRAYGVASVPTVIVDGKYMTSASMTGSNEKLLQVIDFLVDKQAKDRKIRR